MIDLIFHIYRDDKDGKDCEAEFLRFRADSMIRSVNFSGNCVKLAVELHNTVKIRGHLEI